MSRSALTRHALHKATRPSQPHEEQDESSRHVKQDELPLCVRPFACLDCTVLQRD